MMLPNEILDTSVDFAIMTVNYEYVI